MTTYPIEFHRRLEQKWAGRMEQILTVTCAAPRREIPPTTMMMRTKTKTRGRRRGDEDQPDQPAVARTWMYDLTVS